MLPLFLREHANIDKNVVFVGMLKKIEIWSKPKWDIAFKESQEKFPDMSQAMSDMGI